MLEGVTRPISLAACLLVPLALGCGAPAEPDAGFDAMSLVGARLTVDEAAARDQINGVMPRAGFQYYLLTLTLEARGVGPLSIAPFALAITLEDGSLIEGDDDRTSSMTDGCTSQQIPVDGSLTCRVAFVVPVDAAPPATLAWEDASRSATATVPPLI